MVEVRLIAGHDLNRAIGYKNHLPWNFPKDMKWFRENTSKAAILLGRKSLEAILELHGKPLPGRMHYLLTRNQELGKGLEKKFPEQIRAVSSLKEAKEEVEKAGKSVLWVIGGGEIYSLTLNDADVLVLTEIDLKTPQADAWFPEWDKKDFVLERSLEDEENGTKLTFNTYRRIKK